MKNIYLILLLFCASIKVYAYDLTVAKDGSGNYTTVQAAIDAAPANGTAAFTIFIKNGTYKEKITVASNKTFITLIGESVANVILTYDDYSGKAMPGGGTFGTSNSASTTINANDFTAINISFENTTGESPQALAINVNGDRCAFKNCRFLGGQDTLLANGAGKRQYYKQCYIDGTVDFIFGNAAAIFEDCTIYPKTRESGTGNSYITAANTPAGQVYGYVFRNCTINMNRGVTQYYLGRPWQNSTGFNPQAENKVVFLNTTQSSTIINPLGWSTWDAGTQTNLITFAEYQSVKTDATLVDVSTRVAWSKQLTATEAAAYTNANIFGAWDPCAAFAGLCNTDGAEIAVSNFKGTKGTSTSVFNWNASWGIGGVTYTLYRSIDNKASYQSIYAATSTGVYDVNFTYTDNNPPAGSTYYYYIGASKSGLASHTTLDVSISSTPTITVGATGAFSQGLPTPSAAQNYTFSAVNLLGDVTITPPANYQISVDGGTTWSFTPLSISPVSGSIASRTIGVRLNSTTVGTYNGNIVHSSSGALDANVAVTGTTQAAPLPVSIPLLSFPMTANSNDDATVRASGVTTTTPTLSRLTTSTATTPVPAYSAAYGQALCPIGTTNGLWSLATANGGVSDGTGGNLSRTHYVQFTITAASGYSVRVDSFTLNSAFYNTSSSTKLAVVYSRSGFTTDSSDVAGGILGQTGATLATGQTGGFSTPILLTNQTAGNTVNYRLALTNSNLRTNSSLLGSITLTPGQTLTIRVYLCCSSTGVPRYGMLKDVTLKGLANAVLPLSIVDIKAQKNGKKTNTITWTTANEINTTHFDIERSTDGYSFFSIGQTKAKGNTSTQTMYDFIDEKPQVGINYYRLRQTDKDGSIYFTKIVSIDNAFNKNTKLKLYPSVTNSILTVETEDERISSMHITDNNGRVVMTKTVNVEGLNKTQIDVWHLPTGIYFLSVKTSAGMLTERFVKGN